MPNTYHALPNVDVLASMPFIETQPEQALDLDDPAQTLMVDYSSKTPPTISGDLSISQARMEMNTSHTTLNLVVNRSGDLIGIITLPDLMGKKSLAKAHEMGTKLEDVCVKDIMQSLSRLSIVPFRHIVTAKVGDILETFARNAVENIIVIDNDPVSRQPKVRGLIRAEEVAKRLNEPYDYTERAKSFVDIVHAVHGHFG